MSSVDFEFFLRKIPRAFPSPPHWNFCQEDRNFFIDSSSFSSHGRRHHPPRSKNPDPRHPCKLAAARDSIHDPTVTPLVAPYIPIFDPPPSKDPLSSPQQYRYNDTTRLLDSTRTYTLCGEVASSRSSSLFLPPHVFSSLLHPFIPFLVQPLPPPPLFPSAGRMARGQRRGGE